MSDAKRIHGWRRTPALVMVLAALGCSDDPFGLTQSTLERHRARWVASGIRDYQFEYFKQCECLPAVTGPATIEVESGVVRRVVYTRTGESAVSELTAQFPTVDALFDLIQDAIGRGAASLMVSYDGALAYPNRIDIDYDAQVADDELAIDATNLVPR